MSLTQNTLKLALPLAISLALTACGGGGGGGTSSTSSSSDVGFITEDSTDTSTDTDTAANTDTSTETETGTTESEVASLVIYASSRTLLSDADADDDTEGSDPVTIYMMAKDSNNIALSGITFTPSVDNGATLLPGTISSDGILTTWQLIPDEPSNQTVTVSVTAGDITETLSIDIIGTTLQIDGAESISMDKPTTYTVKLKDASDSGLSQQSITLSSTLINATLVTDSEGEAQFDLEPTVGGEYTITAEALGTIATKTITVSPNAFNLTSDVTEVGVDTTEAVTLEWTADGVPQSGKTIHLSATRGQITVNGVETGQVTTDANGNATFDIGSATAGGTVITATDNTTYLSTSLTMEYIATDPHYLNIQADPSIIAALGSSSILAKVRDVNDNPVKGQVVVFNLNDTVDGTISSSKAETDSSGSASIVYTAGQAVSAKDGVVITSHIEGASDIVDTTTLTVGGDAMRLAFGFDELIEENSPFYQKTFGVIVTDNAGNPVTGKQVDFTVVSTNYDKGYLAYDTVSAGWLKVTTDECTAEDLDRDGQLDENEDYNNNGALEPTNSTTISGNSITDESGQATVQISYPQNHAWWETIQITAQVTASGTEYIEKLNLVLPVLASDVSSETSPPNVNSPYGTGSCEEPSPKASN